MLGDWSISKELAKYITDNFNVVLELGSGDGTQHLSNSGMEMHSVENDINYINKHDSNYIYCKLINGWYDKDVLRNGIEYIQYDVILVDGPKGSTNRVKFLDNLDLFDVSKTIIIDDCQRDPELEMAEEISFILNRPMNLVDCADGKKFVII
jgi:hypothetical protein